MRKQVHDSKYEKISEINEFLIVFHCRTYSLSGAYRKVFIKPVDLNWYFMRYNSENDTLIRSDAEELYGDKEPESIENGSQKALIVEFNLPSSSYATMALREFLKSDTSVAGQVHLQQTTANNQKTTDAIVDSKAEPKHGITSDAKNDSKNDTNDAKDDTGNDAENGAENSKTDDIASKKPKLDISTA